MKEAGAILSPSEPGIDWQRAGRFPAQELLHSVRDLQERALQLEIDNVELRRAQLGHTLSPDEFSNVYDSMRCGYVELDDATTIRNINAAGAKLLGNTPLQLVGKRFDQFISSSQTEELHRHLQRCASTDQRVSTELLVEPPDHAPLKVQALCMSREHDNLFRVALADVTKVSETQENIFRLASFPAFNPNPILEFAADGTLIWFNDAAIDLAKFLGLSSPLQIAPPLAAEFARECIKTGESRAREETVIGDRHIYWWFFPVEPRHIVHCYGTDLTERLQLESQIETSKKLETVGHLAANVAHDFNNVLGIIQGYTCLLLSQPGLPTETNESLRQISTAAERATHLTHQLMTFSRKQVFQPKTFNLNDLIKRLTDVLRGLLGQNVQEEFKLAANLPPVTADPSMVEQIVVNVAANARDAMPRGGKFTLSTEEVEATPDLARRNPEAKTGKFVCLTIRDTGQGMDTGVLSKIFEPFFTTKEGALGLGLSSVYGIVKQHHGWIDVQSELGVGSTFRFYFPIAPAGAGKVETPNMARPSEGAETILVVEDEPALRELVARQLRRKGFKVILANSAREALGLWSQHSAEIDLLFTDMVMPDAITGAELAATLQAQKPDLQVVYTSGYSLEVLQQDFALPSDVHFLQKPYQQDALIKAIRAALDAPVIAKA